MFFSGFSWFLVFFSFLRFSIHLIIDQSRREVIACIAVNLGSWIGCGSPRFQLVHPEGFCTMVQKNKTKKKKQMSIGLIDEGSLFL